MIGVVDYGLGNVQAFLNIYRRLGVAATAVQDEAELREADYLILPGVGAFDWVMERLEGSGMVDALNNHVLKKKPILGVCVGMQIMARQSEEGRRNGLGWLDADVSVLDVSMLDHSTHLPHMGWNEAVPTGDSKLFADINNPQYYFLHSYFLSPDSEDIVLSRTSYGDSFVSAVQKNNIFATQFHPEKSHDWGIKLLKNFSEV